MSEPFASDGVRFQRPSLPSQARIERYFEQSRQEGWFSNGGPCWRLLGERLADRVSAYCVPVANGTLGLMVALAALLEPEGRGATAGRALMPSFTFPATAQAALWCGLKPCLLDVHADHWHLEEFLLERALGDRAADLAAVIAVSSFGTPAPAETRLRWERACAAAGLPLLVDSAAGFGAVAEDGVPVGAQGDVEVVSFHATKPFAIGEGGAVFTRSRRLCERIELAVNFGLTPDRAVAQAHGLNAKMSELHAATALAVLDELDTILATRRRQAAEVRDLAGPGVAWQLGCEGSTWQFMPAALADVESRREAEEACRGRVETRRYYEPLHAMEPFREWPIAHGDLANTEALHERLLCLPMANELGQGEIASIAAPLAAASGGARRGAMQAG